MPVIGFELMTYRLQSVCRSVQSVYPPSTCPVPYLIVHWCPDKAVSGLRHMSEKNAPKKAIRWTDEKVRALKLPEGDM